MDLREIAVFAPLVLLVLWMGIYPASFLGHGGVRRQAGPATIRRTSRRAAALLPTAARMTLLSGWFTQE